MKINIYKYINPSMLEKNTIRLTGPPAGQVVQYHVFFNSTTPTIWWWCLCHFDETNLNISHLRLQLNNFTNPPTVVCSTLQSSSPPPSSPVNQPLHLFFSVGLSPVITWWVPPVLHLLFQSVSNSVFCVPTLIHYYGWYGFFFLIEQ